MTSCLAFEKYGTNCEAEAGGAADNNKCRLSANLNDGTCQELVPPGNLYRCTYSCWDGESGQSSWCREGAVCDYPGPVCQVQ